jgi:hypothetical protein
MRLKSMITSLLVVTSFLVAPISNSSALEIKVAPANWGYIYASGNSVSVQATPRLPSANVGEEE